ncbi:hypothetical protein K7432_013079 [Basidiobolus ranarum]|uniref:Right handed beta helix domain-containing protein n=1 Tax=Basidiobolus ranarum TaxID=34480 RepID=A0ABR2WJY9_9FUNG
MVHLSTLFASTILACIFVTGSAALPERDVLDDPLPPCIQTLPVSDAKDLVAKLGKATPGSCFILNDGDYSAIGDIRNAKGTQAAPIVIRAKNTGKAVLTKVFKFRDNAYVVLDGFTFNGSGQRVEIEGCQSCRITRSSFKIRDPTDGKNYDWLVIKANSDSVRIDRCDFGPKKAQGSPIIMASNGASKTVPIATNLQIDRSYFHDLIPTSSNGGEAIALGNTHPDFPNGPESGANVQYNLFEACDGDAEIISVKSSGATLRYNTIRNSAGGIVLRNTDNSKVYGNTIDGNNKKGSTGIRLHGTGHSISNNLIYNIDGNALMLSPKRGDTHRPANKSKSVHNTFFAPIEMSWNENPTDSSLFPSDNTIANNIIGGTNVLLKMTKESNTIYTGNLVLKSAKDVPANGFAAVADFKLNSNYMLTSSSPSVNSTAVTTTFWVSDDIQGQPRDDGKPDVGADELSNARIKRNPLTPEDVGPSFPL